MKGFKISKENIERLDDPKREEYMPKSKILKTIGDLSGKSIADLGCGTGYYSKDFSELVGLFGKVYSIDVNPELMEQVIFKTKDLKNVVYTLSNEDSIPIESGIIDVTVSVNTFHEFDQDLTLTEVRRIMKPKGKFYIIDWSPEVEPPPGPPADHRILKEDVILVFEDIGFKLLSEFSISPYHYGMVFERI